MIKARWRICRRDRSHRLTSLDGMYEVGAVVQPARGVWRPQHGPIWAARPPLLAWVGEPCEASRTGRAAVEARLAGIVEVTK